MMDKLLSQDEFKAMLDRITIQAQELGYAEKSTVAKHARQNMNTRREELEAAYAAALARIATLEAELAAKQEQIERLLAECAHS